MEEGRRALSALDTGCALRLTMANLISPDVIVQR
jgi:hypothetical protein